MRRTSLYIRLGDLAARAAAETGSVIVECEPRLTSLFARSFPGCAVRPANLKTLNGVVTADYAWLKEAGGANAAIPMGSLPRYLRGSITAFPRPNAFLKVDAGEELRWNGEFAAFGSPVIGLCWRSGKSGGYRAVQYAPLAAWAEFIKSFRGHFVRAQYDATAEEIGELEALSGRRVFRPRSLDQKNELDRTAAMLSALDFLVSAPTAVSWLGAGVGIPTFKILYDTSWISFGQAYEPLAPSCVCVAPKNRGDWTDVFAQTAAAITAQL